MFFSALSNKELGLWFTDYNRVLGEMYEDYETPPGKTGSRVRGKARVISSPTEKFEEGEILICEMTTPAHIPLMKKAAGIITEKGGVLSHAAITARELGIPCITGTKNATDVFKDGELIEVDGEKGVIRKL